MGRPRRLFDSPLPWGNEGIEEGEPHCNTWNGTFPTSNTEWDGFVGTAPVGSYEPNGYGIHDVAGNVWEICSVGMTKAIIPPTQWIRLPKIRAVQKRGDILLNRMTRNASCGAAHSCAIGATARVTAFQHVCHFQPVPA